MYNDVNVLNATDYALKNGVVCMLPQLRREREKEGKKEGGREKGKKKAVAQRNENYCPAGGQRR